jgi:hypothetical protein
MSRLAERPALRSGRKPAPDEARDRPPPVIQVTRYDEVSSWMITIFAGLLALCLVVVMVWASNRLPKPPEPVPVEMLELPGGFEDGNPDETLKVDSPEPERADASMAETPSEQTEIEKTMETALQMSEAAAQQVQPQFDVGVQSTGKPGSASGTGGRPLGSGPGLGGFSREQRWFVRFGERDAVEEYARQLDFFKIELGALLPDGRLAYLSKMSTPAPQIRYVQTGASEKRLLMTWQGGERRGADLELFQKAGLGVSPDAPMMHFYPPDLESKLAELEKSYRNKSPKQIRRTYFSVVRAGGGYQLRVTRQLYLN